MTLKNKTVKNKEKKESKEKNETSNTLVLKLTNKVIHNFSGLEISKLAQACKKNNATVGIMINTMGKDYIFYKDSNQIQHSYVDALIVSEIGSRNPPMSESIRIYPDTNILKKKWEAISTDIFRDIIKAAYDTQESNQWNDNLSTERTRMLEYLNNSDSIKAIKSGTNILINSK